METELSRHDRPISALPAPAPPANPMVAAPPHHDGVLVRARSRTGEWMMWRVGRHRLAWRPIPRLRFPAPGYEYNRADEGQDMLSWAGALLATPVVWPWRMATGKWPVVAYLLYPIDGDTRQRRTPPLPRAEADDLVRLWAEHIEQHGEPPYPRRDGPG